MQQRPLVVDLTRDLTYTSGVERKDQKDMFAVVQVSVGQPRPLLGTHRGKVVISAIGKSGVRASLVTVTRNGIEGDKQADERVVRGRRIHGGPFQAVYAYPLEHLAPWAAELGISDRPGIFGENLTVAGIDEHDVRVGDVFRWGDVELRVTKPRRPCYKLPIHLEVDDAALRMNQNGRCGFYLEVVTPGAVRTSAGLELVRSDSSSPTIASVFAAKVRADPTIPGA